MDNFHNGSKKEIDSVVDHVLSNLSINDLQLGTSSNVTKFIVGTKLFRVVKTKAS